MAPLAGGKARLSLGKALPWWPWHLAFPLLAMLQAGPALRPAGLGLGGQAVLALGGCTLAALAWRATGPGQVGAAFAALCLLGGAACWGRSAAQEGMGPEDWHLGLLRGAWPFAGFVLAQWGCLRLGWWPEAWVLAATGGTGDRPAWPMGHPNPLGAALLLPTAVAFLAPPFRPGLALALALAIAASGSRAAGLAALGLAMVGAWRGRGRWALAPAAALLVAGLLGLWALGPGAWAHWGALLPHHPSFDQARLAAWSWTWDQSLASPWVGVGPVAWWPLPLVLRPGLPHPHQAYLHLAWALGWPLALAWVGLAWGAALRLWRLGPQGLPLAAGLGAWWAIAWVDEAPLEARLLLLASVLVAWAWSWAPEGSRCG